MQPKINSVNGLKQYVLRRLGHPVHQIEITDDQLQDAIDDTLDDYRMYAYSGVVERFLPIKLMKGIQEYLLPYSVFAVINVADANMSMLGASLPSNLFSINQFIAADLYRPGVAKIDLLGYDMINQLTAGMDIVFGRKKTFDFNSISKILYFHGTVMADENVFIQVYQKLDLEKTPDPTLDQNAPVRYLEENVYNEPWIKRMTTARAKLQWGINIGLKYQGSVLPNGGTLNGQGIIDQAEAEIEKLTEELHTAYELPIDFFIG